MKRKLILFLSCFLFYAATAFFQNVDSLKRELKKATDDTARVKLYADLSNVCQLEEIPNYLDPLMVICVKELKVHTYPGYLHSFYATRLAVAFNNMAFLANQLGKVEVALSNYEKALEINKEENDKKGIAGSLNNIGYVYSNQGNIPLALDYYLKGLKIQEEIKDNEGMALTLNNIGAVYKSQRDFEKALDYYSRSLKLKQEMGDKQGVAISLNNIGLLYKIQAGITETTNPPESKALIKTALNYYDKSLKIREEIGDKKGIANVYNNIGVIYENDGDLGKALDYYLKGLTIREIINDKEGITLSYNSLGAVYLKQQNYGQAENYGLKALKLAQELGYPQDIGYAAQSLYEFYKVRNDGMKALSYFELYTVMKDSINNTETQKAGVQKEMEYEFDKKDALAKADQDKKDLLVIEETHRQTLIRNSFIGGFVLVCILGLVVFRSYKQKQKANRELEEKNMLIEEQKNMVEEKHKEITDSINYAERIQRSFLATKELLDENLGEYFVFFQPKDVVSGDFYWAIKLKNNQFGLVTADSTGHGVPGAIMSILNISSLEKAVEIGLYEPAEILNHTRIKIIERLKKDGSEQGGKDGMDCSLISFDFKSKQLTYAAANNPIWIVRGETILEFAPDKMPVGKHDRDTVSFTQHTIQLKKGDMVYALTDGMPDQFGGLKGKKYMYKQLKDLLISVAQLPMPKQKEMIAASLDNWKGNLEQIDDITLIGVRV